MVNNKRRSAWLEMYLAQKDRKQLGSPAAVRGRPARVVLLDDIHTKMSRADREILLEWKSIFDKLLGRAFTLGEVAGLLARICKSRLDELHLSREHVSPEEFVAMLIGETDAAGSQ